MSSPEDKENPIEYQNSLGLTSFTVKNFHGFVGQIDEIPKTQIPHHQPSTPTIRAKRKITSATRKSAATEQRQIGEGGTISINRPPPKPKTQVKRILSRKTAHLVNHQVNGIYSFNGPSADMIHETLSRAPQQTIPGSPRRKIRKTLPLLSPPISSNRVDSPRFPTRKPLKSTSLETNVDSQVKKDSSQDAKVPTASSELDDEKISNILPRTTAAKPSETISKEQEEKINKEKELELARKKKLAFDLIQSRSIVQPTPKKRVPTQPLPTTSPLLSNATPSQAQQPKPKPPPDPKKSLEAQKYIKEKRLQEVKKKQLQKKEEEKQKQKVTLALKRIDDERRAQREAILKAKQLLANSKIALQPGNHVPKPADSALKTVPIPSNPIVSQASQIPPSPPKQVSTNVEVVGKPVILEEPRISVERVSVVTIPTTLPTPTVTEYPSQKPFDKPQVIHGQDSPEKDKSEPLPAPAFDKKVDKVEEVKLETKQTIIESVIEKGDTKAPVVIDAAKEKNISAIQKDDLKEKAQEEPINQEKKALQPIEERLLLLAQEVSRVGERLMKIDREKKVSITNTATSVKPSKPIVLTAFPEEKAKRKVIFSNPPSPENVGVSSLAEYTKKRKETERSNDAALVIQAFYKRQKKRQTIQKLNEINIDPTFPVKVVDAENLLMEMFEISNRKPTSPKKDNFPKLSMGELSSAAKSVTPHVLDPAEPKLMNMFEESNRLPKSPVKAEPVQLSPERIPFEKFLQPFFKDHSNEKDDMKEKEKNIALVEMVQSFHPTSDGPTRLTQFLNENQHLSNNKPSSKAARNVEFVSKTPQPKFSILDLIVKKLEKSGVQAIASSKSPSKPGSVAPESVPVLAATSTIESVPGPSRMIKESLTFDKRESVSILPAFVQDIRAPKPDQKKTVESAPAFINDLSSLKSISREIQTEMEVSDVSELSELHASYSYPKQSQRNSSLLSAASSKKDSSFVMDHGNTEDYLNDSFDSLDSLHSYGKHPSSPPMSQRQHFNRSTRVVGASMTKSDFMGADGQGKVPTHVLGHRHDLVINYYEAVTNALHQVEELKGNRNTALSSQEAAALLQVYVNTQKEHSDALEAAKAQRLSTHVKTTDDYVQYDESFDSYSEPKIINRKTPVKVPATIESDSEIEEIIEGEDTEKFQSQLQSKEKKVSKVEEVLNDAVDLMKVKAVRQQEPAPRKSHRSEDSKNIKLQLKLAEFENASVPARKTVAPVKKQVESKLESDDSISENLPSSHSLLFSDISENLPSSPKKGHNNDSFEENLYSQDSFYSMDDGVDKDISSSSSIASTEEDADLKIQQENLKKLTKRLDPKSLAKKEKILNANLEAVEKLKSLVERERTLQLKQAKLSCMLDEYFPTTAPVDKTLVSKKIEKSTYNDSIKNLEATSVFRFEEVSNELDQLQDDVSLFNQDLKYIGNPNSPKKTAAKELAFSKQKSEAPATEEVMESKSQTYESDEILLKLNEQIMNLDRQLNARRTALENAETMDRKLRIQKTLDVKLRLEQELSSQIQKESIIMGHLMNENQSSTIQQTQMDSDIGLKLNHVVQKSIDQSVGLVSTNVISVDSLPSVQSVQPETSSEVSTPKKEAAIIASNQDQLFKPDEVVPVVENAISTLVSSKRVDESQPKQSIVAQDDQKSDHLVQNEKKDIAIPLKDAPLVELVKPQVSGDDTTSDLITEHLSQYDNQFSEKIEKDEVSYEEDFESEESFEGGRQASISPPRKLVQEPLFDEDDSPKTAIDLVTDSIFADLIADALQFVKSAPIPAPRSSVPPYSSPSRRAISQILAPAPNPFLQDLQKGVELSLLLMDECLAPGSKFMEPPSIGPQIIERLPKSVSALIIDCLESAMMPLFDRHRLYNQPVRALYGRKMIRPTAIPKNRLMEQCKKSMNEWLSYRSIHGMNLDSLISVNVKAEGKKYCDIGQDEAEVKKMLVESIWENLLSDTIRVL